MKESELIKIIEDETSYFINNIAKELEETHDKWFDNFGFPMFGSTSKDYHEQVYFQYRIIQRGSLIRSRPTL